jgi:protein-S-isoprenylcysteine O-methyltransferase Ste14
MPGFLGTHTAALAVLVASLVTGGLLEWMVTLRERAATTLASRPGAAAYARLALGTLGEVTLTRTSGSAPEDRGTKRLIVGSAAAALLLGVLAARRVPSLELPGTGWGWFALGLALVWAGFGLRIWAIATLGRFFRRIVVVQEEHVVVRTGPYRLIRHPAYTGNLVMYAGLGLALVNLLSLAVLIVLPVAGHLPRIRVEEAELTRGLGEPYRLYAAETSRLVPGVW